MTEHEPGVPISRSPVQEDPSALPTIYIGVVGVLFTVIGILFCAWIYYAVDVSIAEEVYAADVVEYTEAKARQTGRLPQYRVTQKHDSDPRKSTYGIPIDEAIKLIAKEHGK